MDLVHREWLMRAIELSERCARVATSYAVGAILVNGDQELVATGYSLETGEHLHAEEIAIARAGEQSRELGGSTLYTSLEPCSVRKSGRTPCTTRVLESGIRRVVYALDEPPFFVHCQGAGMLRSNGVEVLCLAELAPRVRRVNRHLFAAYGDDGGALP